MVGVAIVGIHLRLCHQQLTRERNFSLLAHVKTVLVNVSVTPRVVVSLQILAYIDHDRGSNTPWNFHFRQILSLSFRIERKIVPNDTRTLYNSTNFVSRDRRGSVLRQHEFLINIEFFLIQKRKESSNNFAQCLLILDLVRITNRENLIGRYTALFDIRFVTLTISSEISVIVSSTGRERRERGPLNSMADFHGPSIKRSLLSRQHLQKERLSLSLWTVSSTLW